MPAGEPVEILEFRGNICDASNHLHRRMRRAPPELEPAMTELLPPGACFSPDEVAADFDCNDRIGLSDFGLFADHYRREQPDCAYSSDFDFDDNGRVGLSDFGLFADVYRMEEE